MKAIQTALKPSHLTPLTDREFKLISGLIYEKFGINLTEEKRSLIVGRLNSLLRQNNFDSFTEYYDYVTKDQSGEAMVELVERISTNHTFFYREADHFKFFFEEVLPELTSSQKQRRQRDLRIWSAGCSSGEEPYMLAMLLSDYFRQDIRNWDAGVLATDISKAILDKAMTGLYSDDNVQSMPAMMKSQYFKKHPDGNWSVEDKAKQLVLFRSLNLMRPKFPFKKQFQTIFCRNVMIYFDSPTKKALVNKFYDNTQEGGYLFIGHSESLDRGDCPYRYVKPAVYYKERSN